ncbi:TPA: prophage tail fiber N-terminal domain-containing protein [Escherichia coli]|uniref:Prophage tail fiber N-terminal domain-containing protein n=2 Tax=Escherichia coli TaxID=562 RepID=A0A8H9XV76_ECOLX|nr:prophage tail fiber N-terminal domain-containing protein [Escherichia coli]EFN8418808.1 phage tail protein [Escherichia coli O145]EEU3137882.1 phage tail protein [Escherichia coli]EFD5022113.1 phage tail protein [Escherichia coli]EFD5037168.1 phage tail protein [Escherichia coli]EFE6090708.1 phage tail protein [Escherichia coli]
MSVLISGALINGAGVPMAECKIYLDALVNTSEVVTESFAVIETDVAGQYAFEAPKGKYTVHIKQKNGPKCCVGDISVYDDSKPGTLNDFLTALDESDLKPDVVKRFEELAQQAQQSAEAAAESEQASDTARSEAINAAKNARLHRNAASSAATSAEQSANVALGRENNAAEYARQAKASQDASAGNAQEAKQHRDEAQRIVDDLKGSNASTTEKGLVQLCSDTDNDSEELAATPMAVKTVMDETKTKAPLDSPAFTGTPTTPTPPDDATGLEMANAAFVRKLLAALVGSSPEALDTLNELAAALGHDPNFATTVTKALAGKQPLNDVLTAVSQITPEENTLPYFSAEGRILLAQLSEKARALLALDTPEAMRTELELKAAATMEPQSDIRDRTPGRLALPGAFGFGYAFRQSERLDFNSDEKFLEWVKNVTEGCYFIYSYNSKIFPDLDCFIGIVDVKLFPSGMSTGNPAKTDKGLFFYSRYQPNSDQSVFYAQYSSAYADGEVTWGLTSVINLSLTSNMLSEHLSTMSGSGAYFQYPGIGVPVLAVYRGTTSGDKEIKIGLGDVVQGSQLGGVNLSCTISSAGPGSYGSTPSAGATGYTFPGRYMALSGVRDSYGTSGRICLFVRIE